MLLELAAANDVSHPGPEGGGGGGGGGRGVREGRRSFRPVDGFPSAGGGRQVRTA